MSQASSAEGHKKPNPSDAPDVPETSYSASPGLAGWLRARKVNVVVSSYESGKVYWLGANPKGGLMVHERFFHRAMGLHEPKPGTLLMASGWQIIRFEDVLDPGQFAENTFDACYVPRQTWTIGAVDAHDVGLLEDGRPIFVNTSHNCLATISDRHSFQALWLPPFVSELVQEDRCHLNGLAMGEGEARHRPAYVTACSKSDTVDGWRDRRANGGVVVDVATGKVVAEGLSMPHSPRLHQGELYVLNSGTGELGRINRDATPDKAFEPIRFCPGFVRGLGFFGKYALVGLSRPRYKRFEGLALDASLAERDSEPWCGVQIIDLDAKRVVEWFRIDGKIMELYDVTVASDVVCAMALSLQHNAIAGLITQNGTIADPGW